MASTSDHRGGGGFQGKEEGVGSMVERVLGRKWETCLAAVWLLTNPGALADMLNFLVFNFPLLEIKELIKSIVSMFSKAVNTLMK